MPNTERRHKPIKLIPGPRRSDHAGKGDRLPELRAAYALSIIEIYADPARAVRVAQSRLVCGVAAVWHVAQHTIQTDRSSLRNCEQRKRDTCAGIDNARVQVLVTEPDRIAQLREHL